MSKTFGTHVPAKTNEGWGVAGLVVLLTAACIVAVTIIHQRTYKNPTDPTNPNGGAKAHTEAPAAH
jgi:hypothetical protein